MRQIDLLRNNRERFERAVERARQTVAVSTGGALESAAGADALAPDAVDAAAEAAAGTRPLETITSANEARAYASLEAIILADMRPAYFINDDLIEIEGDYDHIHLIQDRKHELEALARNVGRVDLIHHPTMLFAGTGWLIEDDIVVTNRHVAEFLAERDAFGGWQPSLGAFDQPIEARIDTVRQNKPGTVGRRVLDVTDILYVSGSREPDIAFLRVERNSALSPLNLSAKPPRADQPVAAIGYPAWDGGRNDPELMQRLFMGIYDVKRFAPGVTTAVRNYGVLALSDYSSLGGNSGSAVVDLETREVVGLHFAGTFRDANYAVTAPFVAAALRRIKTQVTGATFPEMEEAPLPIESFTNRDGYNPAFHGAGHTVPLPALGEREGDLAPVKGDDNGHLKYTHFTVLQSKSRRLPMVTAVNIDGARSFSLKRKGKWRLDPRLEDEHQIGNELYRNNPLDRGHMVRRRDPGWGVGRDEAQQAEIDTFHYTNCAPQHKDLNQRDWVSLEDYILEAAETRDFKVTVFTGPIFRDDDKRLKHQPGAEDIKIPGEFWKLAVMVNDDTGALSATAYVLTQGEMIRNLTEAAFVLGDFMCYQVQVKRIERETGLDFGALRDCDPLKNEPESVFGSAAFAIEGPQDLRL